MGFGEAIQTCLKKYATFSGRASRSEYWWFYLFITLLSVAAAILDLLLLGAKAGETGVLGGIVSITTLVPSLAVTSRRLHDTDRRGWWMLLPVAAITPFLIYIVMRFGPDTPPSGPASGVITATILAGLVSVGLLLYWLIKRGTQGANRFGPDPLGTAADVEGVF